MLQQFFILFARISLLTQVVSCLTCYNCPVQSGRDNCKYTSTCPVGKICMFKKIISSDGHVRYQTLCKWRDDCINEINTYPAIVGSLLGNKRETHQIVADDGECLLQCCDQDKCNVGCSSVTTTTTTTTASTAATTPAFNIPTPPPHLANVTTTPKPPSTTHTFLVPTTPKLTTTVSTSTKASTAIPTSKVPTTPTTQTTTPTTTMKPTTQTTTPTTTMKPTTQTTTPTTTMKPTTQTTTPTTTMKPTTQTTTPTTTMKPTTQTTTPTTTMKPTTQTTTPTTTMKPTTQTTTPTTTMKPTTSTVKPTTPTTTMKPTTSTVATTMITTPVVCEHGSYLFDNGCYIIPREEMTFRRAEAFCASINSRLVQVDSAKENDFLKQTLRMKGQPQQYWIGITDIDTENTWVSYDDHKPATFFDWMPGEPDGKQVFDGISEADCAVFDPWADYQWRDEECSPYQFSIPICEKRAPSRPTTTTKITHPTTLVQKWSTHTTEAMSTMTSLSTSPKTTFLTSTLSSINSATLILNTSGPTSITKSNIQNSNPPTDSKTTVKQSMSTSATSNSTSASSSTTSSMKASSSLHSPALHTTRHPQDSTNATSIVTSSSSTTSTSQTTHVILLRL